MDWKLLARTCKLKIIALCYCHNKPDCFRYHIGRNQVSLYLYKNAGGELLYVGIATDPIKRMRSHRSNSEWFKLAVSVEISWYEDRKAALRYEYAVAGITLHNIIRPKFGKWDKVKQFHMRFRKTEQWE